MDEAERLAVVVPQVVRVGQGRRRLPHEVERLLRREASRRAQQQVLQGRAVHQLHRQHIAPVDPGELEDVDDVRVLEAGADPRLVHELQRVVARCLVDQLDGDGPAVAGLGVVPATPDLAVAPRAQPRLQRVPADLEHSPTSGRRDRARRPHRAVYHPPRYGSTQGFTEPQDDAVRPAPACDRCARRGARGSSPPAPARAPPSPPRIWLPRPGT